MDTKMTMEKMVAVVPGGSAAAATTEGVMKKSRPRFVPIEGWSGMTHLQKIEKLGRFDIDVEDFLALKKNVEKYGRTAPFSPEEAEILLQETGFAYESDERQKKFEAPDQEAIGTGEKECPRCRDRGYVAIDRIGETTGIKVRIDQRCICFVYRQFYKRWHDPRNVGKDYRSVKLSELKRFAANFGTFNQHGQLDVLIDTVTQFPRNCFLLAGPHGLGKSTLLIAMYRRALELWLQQAWATKNWTDAVWIANATTLAGEFRTWETRDDGRGEDEGKPTPLPTIWETKIHAAIRAGHNPCIFIEEFDKFKLDSEFQRQKFHQIIDLVHSSGGQIVVTSNLDEYKLRQRLGENYGAGILRRIAGARGNEGSDFTEEGGVVKVKEDHAKSGYYIDFWTGTWVSPLTWDIPSNS
jgi:hypothetical protein